MLTGGAIAVPAIVLVGWVPKTIWVTTSGEMTKGSDVAGMRLASVASSVSVSGAGRERSLKVATPATAWMVNDPLRGPVPVESERVMAEVSVVMRPPLEFSTLIVMAGAMV